jgi:Zn-dependent M28 family amino/carboxypeptidase
MRIGIIRKQLLFQNITMVLLLVLITMGSTGCQDLNQSTSDSYSFNGERAYADVIYQVALGPRIPGEDGHQRIIEWITKELTTSGWQVEIQETEYQGKPVKNIIAGREQGGSYILIGAHYDTRIFADQDQDPSLRTLPVPGANDGGSGVAVLLELARVLPDDLNVPIRLVFFDSEDNGGIDDWQWIMGSRAFVQDYEILPVAAIIVDMIGDADLNIFYEHNSDELIMGQIWKHASDLGYGRQFQEEFRHSMLDDHTPFIEAGIPAVDIIDFDYPFWHTTEDTVDKVSAESLETVGQTLLSWIISLK